MNRIISQEKLFSTFDLGLASTLISAGYKLFKLNKENPRKVEFIFTSDAGLEQAVENYFSFNFPVDAQTLFTQTKVLKNWMYTN